MMLHHIFKNRWCGAFWQEQGLKVISTISWAKKDSFEFCFNGVEKGSVVAVSTLGARKVKTAFLEGYYAMCDTIKPSQIICFSQPFDEIKKDVIFVDYLSSKWGLI